jgi:chorismate mutase
MSSATQAPVEAKAVQAGAVIVGAGRPAAVIGGGPDGEPDARWITLCGCPGGRPAAEVIEEDRAVWAGTLLVEPSSAADLPAIREFADGVVAGGERAGDPELPRAAAGLGLPLILRRGPAATLAEWLETARRCAAEGADRVVLCESAGRTHGVDLGLMREARARSGRPVLLSLEQDAGLAAAGVAAGADGLLLAPAAGPDAVVAAREAVTLVGAVLRAESPDSVPAARCAIDRVDAVLATLLERRAELAGLVQRLKPVGGFAGRDMERERLVVAAMARRAPRLGEVRLGPVVNAVIEAGLHLAEEDRARHPTGDVYRET